jgi:hypothetical protein
MLYICNMVAILLRDKKQWLSRSTSALLLLLFVLSITPKKTLHDWLVHHEDETSYQQQTAPSILKSGFHCDTDNNVAESPFTGEEPVSLPQPLPAFISFNAAVSNPLHSVASFYFTLRGPPATV